MIQYGLPSYHWYLKIFWDCCRRKFIDSNLMALRVVITSITTSKVRLTLPSFLLHPQNHFIVYCILYRLEFYTASRNWLPLVNFSQQPKIEKSSQNTDIFFFKHCTSPTIETRERGREALPGFYNLQVWMIQLIQIQRFLLLNYWVRKLIKQINKKKYNGKLVQWRFMYLIKL